MSSNNPKLSVIMTVYNGEKYLSEAVESILNQTFTDFEFSLWNWFYPTYKYVSITNIVQEKPLNRTQDI